MKTTDLTVDLILSCGEALYRTSGNRWHKKESGVLEELINRGATQLEIAAALPHPNMGGDPQEDHQATRTRVIVLETRHLENDQTIYDYLEQHPETAAAMPFSILMNSSR